MRNAVMCVVQRSTARIFLLRLMLVHVVLVPANAYNPFGTGAPPTLEMVRAACEGEVDSCELDCNRDVTNAEPRPEIRSGDRDRESASAAEEEQHVEERQLTDLELDHLIKLNRPAAQVKVALRKVSLTKSQIEQLIALEERTPGIYGNRLVVKNMLRGKTPSDKYERKQYCCGEMLRAVLNGSYPLSRIPGAVLPAPIQPVVQCFVPGLRDVEANKALRKHSSPKRDPADDLARMKPVSSDLREQQTEAARRQRKIANDVKCGMCGYVVEDLWACARTVHQCHLVAR